MSIETHDHFRVIEKRINEVMSTRAEHVEKFCAAFFKQVGSHEASQYALVERHEKTFDGFKFTWTFEKRTPEETAPLKRPSGCSCAKCGAYIPDGSTFSKDEFGSPVHTGCRPVKYEREKGVDDPRK
jgi:hypothetical protein